MVLVKNVEVLELIVICFCCVIGYEGWYDFKLKFVQSLVLVLFGVDEMLVQDDFVVDLVNKICSCFINMLLDLCNYLNLDVIQLVLDVLVCVNKIEFYGQGIFGIVVNDVQYKFFCLGVFMVVYFDLYIYSIVVLLFKVGDCVVVILQCGGNVVLLCLIQLVCKGGVDIIVLGLFGILLVELVMVLVFIDLFFNIDFYIFILVCLVYLVVIDIFVVGLVL